MLTIYRHVLLIKSVPHSHRIQVWGRVAGLANALENVGLFSLTYITSKEYYPYHEKAFICWALFSWFKIWAHLTVYQDVLKHNPTQRNQEYGLVGYIIATFLANTADAIERKKFLQESICRHSCSAS